MGRKSIPILLKTTSPEGETKMFTSIGEAAKELGFSECGVGKAFHKKRDRISEYELEWLEPGTSTNTNEAVISKRVERLKKSYTQKVCIYCGKPLTLEDKIKNGFGIYEIDEKTGHIKAFNEVNNINEGHRLTGLSFNGIKNALSKGKVIITRRKDKQRFILATRGIHEECFQIRKGEKWRKGREF